MTHGPVVDIAVEVQEGSTAAVVRILLAAEGSHIDPGVDRTVPVPVEVHPILSLLHPVVDLVVV